MAKKIIMSDLSEDERAVRCHSCGHARGTHSDYHGVESYCHGDSCDCREFSFGPAGSSPEKNPGDVKLDVEEVGGEVLVKVEIVTDEGVSVYPVWPGDEFFEEVLVAFSEALAARRKAGDAAKARWEDFKRRTVAEAEKELETMKNLPRDS